MLIFPAHLIGFAVDGLPTARHAAYYAERAAAGADLIITKEHAVDPRDRPYEKLIRGHDLAVLPGYRLIADAVHAHGARVLAQLNHNGAQSSGMYSREPVRAPSPVPDPMFREVPVQLTVAEIAEIVTRYADVAARCIDGGFDGVELQCAQASLLRQFLSPLTNRRTDAYGGSLGNRVRIVRAVAVAVRAVIGPRLLSLRLTGDEGLPGGITVDDAVATARLLEPHVDLINTSVGVATATLHLVEPPLPVPAGYARGVAKAIRAAVRVPVTAVGRFTRRSSPPSAPTSWSWPPAAASPWSHGDVRDVLSGTLTLSGHVLIYDELGFHHATSTAELLAARGCTVEIMTPGLVVGQDLGVTLDLPGFHRRAHAAGIVLTTDRVIVDGVVLHHPTGTVERRHDDTVVTALPAETDDALWRALDGTIPVHRIGDAVAPRRADAAIREGDAVGRSL